MVLLIQVLYKLTQYSNILLKTRRKKRELDSFHINYLICSIKGVKGSQINKLKKFILKFSRKLLYFIV